MRKVQSRSVILHEERKAVISKPGNGLEERRGVVMAKGSAGKPKDKMAAKVKRLTAKLKEQKAINKNFRKEEKSMRKEMARNKKLLTKAQALINAVLNYK